MEGFFEPASRLAKNTAYTDVARDILNAKRGVGICCFSDTFSNELMWTHYASHYAGICVGYRTQGLVEGLAEEFHLVRVAYDHEPPVITNLDASDARSAAIKILSHKKANWIYEREWRLLGPPGLHRVATKGCVRVVYLGARCSPAYKERILEALDKATIRISEMTVSDYDHNWTELKHLK
jgi:hypothetical protein